MNALMQPTEMTHGKNSPAALMAAIDALPTTIRDVTASSREAREGFVFLAYKGLARDGRDFIAEAVTRGVSAVLFEADGFEWNTAWKVPHLAVFGLKDLCSAIAGHVYRQPSENLWMVGVTGTNGKTSVAQWVAQAFEQSGRHSAVLGTIGNGLVGALQSSDNTTPDAVQLQRALRQYVDAGAVACAMEVSSHGLDQGRVADVKYDIGVFTNLTRDHLDYHPSMEAYGEAKATLFTLRGVKTAVVNVDDAFGRVLALRCESSGLRVIKTACNGGSKFGNLIGSEISVSPAGLSFRVRDVREKMRDAQHPVSVLVESAVLGAFNVSNMLSVIGVLLASGITLDAAANIVSSLQPVPGRMQTVRSLSQPSNKPLVVVDYAHTPDALEKALSTVSAIVPEGGRLIAVFGCGGNRDKGKRALMGGIAARYADFTVVTSDNPRHESPSAIIDDIVPGLKSAHDAHGPAHYRTVEDRHQAIFEAMNEACAQDIVVIAGKGHEDYQIIGDTRQHFSDVEVAREALEAWVSKAQPPRTQGGAR